MKIDVKYIETFWEHLCETVSTENIEVAVDEFDIDVEKIKHTNELSEEEAYTLMCDLVYMALNGLYYGDFDTTYEALVDACDFPEDLAEELLDF